MRAVWAAALAAICVLTACSRATTEQRLVSHSDVEAIAYVNRVLSPPEPGRHGTLGWRVDLVGALPNTRYGVPGHSRTATDLVVIGSVGDVVKMDGFTSDAHEKLPIRVDFDDPHALFKTAQIRLEVRRVISASATATAARPASPHLRVWISVDGAVDFGLLRQGLMRQPRSVFYLDRLSGNASDEPAAYSVARGGSLMVNVAGDGTLSVPLVHDRAHADRLLARAHTLGALLTAASRPSRTVPLPGPG